MTRDRKRPIKVWVSPEERAEIKRLAASANLSLSAYLRTAGLNQQIRSILDVQAVAELAKINGDFGRLAGIQKLWLATPAKRGVGATPFEVEKMMKEFKRLQDMSLQIMGRMTRGTTGEKNDKSC